MKSNKSTNSSSQIGLLAALYGSNERVVTLAPETHKVGFATGVEVAPQQSFDSLSLPLLPTSGIGIGSAVGTPLGSYTESSSPPPLDPQNIALTDQQKTVIDRYYYQSVARKLIKQKGRKAGLEYPLDWHRTGKCHHLRREEKVSIYKSKEHNKAFYGGLMVCGGIWSCPVCAPKIQERRRLEIAHAMDWAYKTMEKKCVMVTITFPHKSWDRIENLLDQHAEALKYLRGGKAWSKYMKNVGFEGLIRALELTYGQNGWHPHTHEIWIVDRNTSAEELREKVLNRWKAACIKAGLLDENDERQVKGFEKHAVDVHDNARTGDYLAKLTEAGQLPEEEKGYWGADREVGKASTKKGLSKGIHPFRLLDRYDAGDKQAGELYAEYMEVMKKKRKRQLYWSQGLKAKVELEEFTDQQLAEKKESPADLFGLLDADDWFYVRYKEAKGEILAIAINQGWEGLQHWLKKAGKEVRAAIEAKRAYRDSS